MAIHFKLNLKKIVNSCPKKSILKYYSLEISFKFFVYIFCVFSDVIVMIP